MANLHKSAALVAQERLKEIRLLRAARFNYITTTEFRENVQAGFEKYEQGVEDWFDRVRGDISDFEGQGRADQGEKLSDILMSNSLVSDPGNFIVYIPTAFGNEQWQIIGTSATRQLQGTAAGSQQHSVIKQKSPDVEVLHSDAANAGRSIQDADESQFLSLAKPIDLDIDDAEVSRWGTVTMQQAIRHKLWLSRTLSGVIFCVECDCPEMVLPVAPIPGSSATETYDLFTRYFHIDPLHQEHALIHFLQVHKHGFSGVKQMLRKHGRRVTLEDSTEDATLDSHDIAGHNLSVRFWYNGLHSKWDDLKETCQESSSRSSRQWLQSHDRTIGFSKVSPAACVFPWPDRRSEHWVVICPHPDCVYPDFEHHPLRKDRAREHFLEHGLYLEDDHDVMRLFGFKVLNYQPEPEPESNTANDQPKAIGQSARKQRRDESGRPRLINGRDVYHIWSYEALRAECVRRKIALPDNYIKKNSLEKKLRLHDGLPDYDAKGVWSYDRLREECINRNIPITSKQMKNVYKRPDLIKMLEKDDVRLRLEAAQAAQEDGPGEASYIDNVPVGHSKLNNDKPDNDGKPDDADELNNDDELQNNIDTGMDQPQKQKRGRGRPPKNTSRLSLTEPQSIRFDIPIQTTPKKSNGDAARDRQSRRASLRPTSRAAASLGFHHKDPGIKEEPDEL